MGRRRDPIKHIRDKAKSNYKRDTKCRICASTQELDFHHYYSLTELFEKWVDKKGHDISTDEKVIGIRDLFIEEHKTELYEETVTLCHPHHMKLHSIYGKRPLLHTANKQSRWVGIQREKNGLV